ncbi:MAG TPA: glutathione S-transferase family protein [Chromatiales bacterium]|nr:glutathione S-transferase family protein [Chromatiales bacterium]
MNLPRLKLVSFALCPYVQRARITLLEKEIEHEIEYIDLNAPPPWFFEVSPLEKVPVLLADDRPVFESMVICEYLDEITPGSLHPEDAYARAQNRAWIEFGNDILGHSYTLFTTGEERKFKQTVAVLADRFDILEEQLAHRPYFNGKAFSLVDAVYAPIFRAYEVMNKYFEFDFLEDIPAVLQWWQALLQRASVQQSVPADYIPEMTAYLKRQDSVLSRYMTA